MKKFLSTTLLVVALGGLLAACGGSSDDNSVTVSDVWTRVTAPGATTGAVYATIDSPDDNKLVGAGVPAEVAGKTEIHETTGGEGGDSMSGDQAGDSMPSDEGAAGSMMGMKPVSSIALPAGEKVALEPGGYHIMLLELAKPIKDGDSIPVTLEFENGDPVEVDATAKES